MNMQDEYICDYLVTAEKKRSNAVYIDLIDTFDSLCERAGITYWVFCGALIGAVRHKGFVPWDDDIDVLMPRADFDRLLSMTNKEFGAEAPYFLQNPVTEPACVQSLIRFRRSDTAEIRDYDLGYLRLHPNAKPYNMGFNLAIFPLDAYPKSQLVARFQKNLTYTLRGIHYRSLAPKEGQTFQHRLCRAIVAVLGDKNMMKLIHWGYRMPRRVDPDRLQSFYGIFKTLDLWPVSDFRDTVRLPFEDTTIRAPIGYDDVLTRSYGNYMELPPVEKRVAKHDSYMNPDESYLQVIDSVLAEGIH